MGCWSVGRNHCEGYECWDMYPHGVLGTSAGLPVSPPQTWMDMICVWFLKQEGYQSDALMTKSSRTPIGGSCKRPHSSSGPCLFSPWSYCSNHQNVINNSRFSVYGCILLKTKFFEREAFLILIFLFIPNTWQCADTQQILDGWLDELRDGLIDE